MSDDSTPLEVQASEPVLEMTRGQAMAAIAMAVRDREHAEAQSMVAKALLIETVRRILSAKWAAPGWSAIVMGLVLVILHMAGIGVDLSRLADSAAHAWTGAPHTVECAPLTSPQPEP